MLEEPEKCDPNITVAIGNAIATNREKAPMSLTKFCVANVQLLQLLYWKAVITGQSVYLPQAA